MKQSQVLFSFLLCFLSGAAYAQSEAMLTGKIVDSAGINIPGCRMKVSGCDKTDSSDKDGVYRLFLLPGKYELQLFRNDSTVRRRTIEIPPVEFYEVDFNL